MDLPGARLLPGTGRHRGGDQVAARPCAAERAAQRRLVGGRAGGAGGGQLAEGLDPKKTVIAGDSAGGGLTLALAIGLFVLRRTRPEAALELVNRAILRQRNDDRFCSAALAIIAFAVTWGCMSVIQVLSRFAPKSANRPN